MKASPSPAQLEIRIGPSGRSFAPLQKGSLAYYPLQPLSLMVGLELAEEEETLTVVGPVGRLHMVNGRPLVRTETEYVLLSGPVWKRGPGDWYVTEDFLTTVLPRATSRQITRISDGRYRLEELPLNEVHVEVHNHPNHVSILFHAIHQVEIEVSESQQALMVAFKGLPVQPHFPVTPPDRRFVTSVEFEGRGPTGVFRIGKGSRYGRFTETVLSDRTGTVVNVYGANDRPAVARPLVGRPSARRIQREIVIIDPGHGGLDRGAALAAGLVEKSLALKLANALGNQLAARNYDFALTRTRDVDLTADQRSAVSNHYGARAFISIHVAASQSRDQSGPVVYFHRYQSTTNPFEANIEPVGQLPQPSQPNRNSALAESDSPIVPWASGQQKHLSDSRRLAQQLQQHLNQLWGTTNQSRAVPMGALAPIDAPAVLIEVGYLTHSGDAEKLQSESLRSQWASTVANTLLGFLESQRPERQVVN